MGMKNIIIRYNYNVKLSDLDIIKDTLIRLSWKLPMS